MSEPKAKPKPGECVFCRIQTPAPGGYLVDITGQGMEGFLPSNKPIDIGRVVPATFVCMNGEQALLTYAFIMGTSARVQHSTASDQENAFSVWAEAYPNANRPNRGVDLVMPSILSSPILLKLSENSAKEVFSKIEATEFTGCIKVFCQKMFSRAAVIFHHGRCVGAVYTKKPIAESFPFEIGLRKMLEDVSSPDADAEIEMYELPAEIVLSMSALFLGYIDQRDEELDNVAYAEKILAHFSEHKTIGCLNVMQESQAPCALGFVCNGEFYGTYTIAGTTFSKQKEFLLEFLGKNPDTKLQAFILPPAMTTDSIRFGYSLSSEHFAGQA